MKKLLISRIGLTATALLGGIAIGVSIGKGIKTDEEKMLLNETTTYIQDMKEWMYDDMYNGTIPEDYANYYIEGFNNCEDMLINLDSITN